MPRQKGRAQLTRAVLADDISDLLRLPRGKHGECAKATAIVNAILRVIIDALRRGEEVRIPGLGTFRVILGKPGFASKVVEPKFNGKRAHVGIVRRKRVRFYPAKDIGHLYDYFVTRTSQASGE